MFEKFYFGSDYNPDQWPEESWPEDIRLMKLAGINLVTLPVFSWSKLEPSDGHYDLDWLGRAIDLLHQGGIRVNLATPTNVPPFWLTRKNPDIMATDQDGRPYTRGERGRNCPSSLVYKEKAAAIAAQLARRFASHPAVAMWHINNEMLHRCFCGRCAGAFRDWLRAKYGSLDELNRAWYSEFWGHRVYAWEEIDPPTTRNEIFTMYGRQYSTWPALSLDHSRFSSEAILGLYLNEKTAIRDHAPSAVITTNFIAPQRHIDWHGWAGHLDVAAYDSYPSNDDHPSEMAYWFSVLRGMKGGAPFVLMEQSPGAVNWMRQASLKRPGQMRLWTHQALAHGADAAAFFQFKASRAGYERYHGAVVSHAGHERTRTFEEVARTGKDLENFGARLLGSRVKSRVALLMDWDNWNSVDNSLWPSADLRYQDTLKKYFRLLWEANIQVDVVPTLSSLESYDLVLAPLLYMVKPGVAAELEKFVRRGGTLVSGFLSGHVDEKEQIALGGYPGELRGLFGIWSEEIDALSPEKTNQVRVVEALGPLKGNYVTRHIHELPHLEGARALAVYGADFYAGRPAVTENRLGEGRAIYVATDADEPLLADLLGHCCIELGIKAPLNAPPRVEVSCRQSGKLKFIFVLNHGKSGAVVEAGEFQGWHDLCSGKTLGASLELAPSELAILAPPADHEGNDGQ